MIRSLLLFLSTLAAWGATLWFGIKPDFNQWSQPAIVALHLGPPLALAAAWGLWRLIRWHSERRAAQAAQTDDAQAQAQRQAAQEEARKKHAEELRQRQTGCDCRGLAMMQVAQPENAKPAFGLQGNHIDFSPFAGGAAEDVETLAHLRTGIVEALERMYNRCPGAAVFPVYVVPPAEVVGEEVLACVQEARQAILADLGLRERTAADFHRCLFLPSGDSGADSAIGLFDSAPDLPGAVVLAFDSAWLRAAQTDDEYLDPLVVEQRKWIGQPSQGVFALLLTHPNLETMLDAAEQIDYEPDAMTPHWDRGLPGSGYQILLAAQTAEEKNSLRQAPVLARIHRSAFAPLPEGQRQALALVRHVQGLVERAQVNAALIDSPFDTTADAQPEDTTPDCGWLVHNAGGVDRSGNRLAALGTALYNRGLSVDPIDTATNVVVQGGDYGQARGVALLALTVARAAEEQAAALGAEFSGSDGLGLFFAVPPGSAA